MDFTRLNYFYVLAETQNLREASEILGISPPALSKSMKILEDEMNTQLWVRDGRRVRLTDKGKILFKKLPHLLQEAKSLKDSLVSEKPINTPISIGTFEVFSTYFLSFLKTDYWQNKPVVLHELLPGEIEKYVREGNIDFGITYMPIPDPQLDFLKVTSIEMGVFCLRGAFKGISQDELPFVVPVMPIQGVPTRVRGLDGWPDDAYMRKVVHQVTLLESALELCRQGSVAGYFPAFIAHEHNLRVKDEFKLERRKSIYSNRTCYSDVYIVKRKSSTESKDIKQLAKSLRSIGN